MAYEPTHEHIAVEAYLMWEKARQADSEDMAEILGPEYFWYSAEYSLSREDKDA